MNRTIRKYRVSIDSSDRNREEYPESNNYIQETFNNLDSENTLILIKLSYVKWNKGMLR